jgi:hypothetical protein
MDAKTGRQSFQVATVASAFPKVEDDWHCGEYRRLVIAASAEDLNEAKASQA